MNMRLEIKKMIEIKEKAINENNKSMTKTQKVLHGFKISKTRNICKRDQKGLPRQVSKFDTDSDLTAIFSVSPLQTRCDTRSCFMF